MNDECRNPNDERMTNDGMSNNQKRIEGRGIVFGLEP